MSSSKTFTPTDKAIYDALNQSSVTAVEVKEMFLARGVLISKDSSRRELADYFSGFVHDYYDYERLERIFGHSSRRERKSSMTLHCDYNDVDFDSSISSFQSALEENDQGVRVNYKKLSNGEYHIDIEYQDTSFNRSDFKQVVNRDASIVIRKSGTDLVVEANDNKFCSEWVGVLVSNISEDLGEDIDTSKISLSHVYDSSVVNEFFELMSRDLPGFELVDVSYVIVYHPDSSGPGDDDEEVTLGTKISNAALRGEGVLKAGVLKGFFEKGFYITKIVWLATRRDAESLDKYEFEVQFGTPESKEDFSFIVKGFYRCKAGGEYTKARTNLPNSEEVALNRTLYEHADACLKKIS